MNKKILKQENNKLNIKDATLYLDLLYNDESSAETLKELRIFAYKQKSKIADDIPNEDYDSIVNMAIVKAKSSFKEGKASFQSYLYMKIRGEVSLFRYKRNSTQEKLINAINNTNEDEEYIYQKENFSTTNENTLELIDSKDILDKFEEEDSYKRQIKAFKIAFSGIPRILQNIINESAAGRTISEIAYILNMEEKNVLKYRNYALSLVLQRVLRGYHILEEEKEAIKETHGLIEA